MNSTPRLPTPSTTNDSPRVVLGVAGGIAAYKAVEVLRRLRDAGCYVQPVLTPDATRFVGTVTFSALASEPARTVLYGDPTTPIPHTYLGQGASVVVVAPATAHLIARYAMGLGDDLLTATLLATRAPVILCPAMHTEMWEQPSVQANLATLRARGVMILEPDEGALAGGDEGKGRLRDPETIAQFVLDIVRDPQPGPLSGVAVLVTAGGTREAIDPVRVLTNRSSGRQGFALAEVAVRLGASVTLVTSASLELAPDVRKRVTRVKVESAAEMADAVFARQHEADVIVMAAAVADFTAVPAPEKIKKREGVFAPEFVPTVDILATLGARRQAGQILVGFAAETTNVVANAAGKLASKGVDFVVANDVSAPHVGFDVSTNEVTILAADGTAELVALRSKDAVAYEILSRVAERLGRRQRG